MFKGIKIAASAAFAIIATMQTPANAFGPGMMARNLATGGNLEFVSASVQTPAPMAHIDFCKSNPRECMPHRTRWSRAAITMDEKQFAVMSTVNRQINRTDAVVTGGLSNDPNHGTLSVASADRDGLAVAKRHALIANGFPARALRLTTTHGADGEAHLVLIAKTKSGDLVLDDRTDAIRRFNKTDAGLATIERASRSFGRISL